jgi:hypothetical protein
VEYRGGSLTKKRNPLGPYCRPVRREGPGGVGGGGGVFWARCPCTKVSLTPDSGVSSDQIGCLLRVMAPETIAPNLHLMMAGWRPTLSISRGVRPGHARLDKQGRYTATWKRYSKAQGRSIKIILMIKWIWTTRILGCQ